MLTFRAYVARKIRGDASIYWQIKKSIVMKRVVQEEGGFL